MIFKRFSRPSIIAQNPFDEYSNAPIPSFNAFFSALILLQGLCLPLPQRFIHQLLLQHMQVQTAWWKLIHYNHLHCSLASAIPPIEYQLLTEIKFSGFPRYLPL